MLPIVNALYGHAAFRGNITKECLNTHCTEFAAICHHVKQMSFHLLRPSFYDDVPVMGAPRDVPVINYVVYRFRLKNGVRWDIPRRNEHNLLSEREMKLVEDTKRSLIYNYSICTPQMFVPSKCWSAEIVIVFCKEI